MFALSLPANEPEHTVSWGDVPTDLLSLVVSELIPTLSKPLLILAENAPHAQRLYEELQFYLASTQHSRLLLLPDYETLPYDHFSPHPDIIAARLQTLYRLSTETAPVLILPLSSALHRMPPASYLLGQRFDLRKGQIMPPKKLQAQLLAAGYHPVSQVLTPGEFTTRGSLLDLFPMGAELPYRVEFDNDEIASLRTFDPENQRSLLPLDHLNLLPAREYPFDEAAISHFREQWRLRFAGNPMRASAYAQVTQGHSFGGVEYYLPLFFEKTVSLWDYLAQNALCLYPVQLNTLGQQYWSEIEERYHRYSADIERPLLPPSDVFIPIAELFQIIREFSALPYGKNTVEITPTPHLPLLSLPDLQVRAKEQNPYAHLLQFLQENHEKKILFCSESPGRRQMLHATLQRLNIVITLVNTWQDFLQSEITIGLIEAPLSHGFWIKDHCIVITENDLYGMQVVQSRRRKAKATDPDAILRSLAELNIGAAVVHRDHGVGRFAGLEIISVFDEPTEFVILLYADETKLYVPVTDLQLISRYLGDAEHAPLHRLGSEQWQKQKQQAKAKIRDVAAQLLEVYAKRNLETTTPCQPPDLNFAEFCQKFPFEETPDQAKAIADVLHDLTEPKVMDRLICGDVGFGKTEVAMRAAFLACQSNKQVVLLVPTTLLAQQHYDTFSDRFADYPITIELLSRFRSQKESTDVITNAQQGKIDILIGTHKLLQNNIRFKNLGLIIIDEEHRFGVMQKETLKKLRAHVDVLTLTATPIPRTLNMAMNGLRDLSLITTPPPGRLAIRTFMLEKDKIMLREAILRELLRGGQVFYLYNEVATIERICREVSDLVPEAKVGFAHGQMRERELERIMSDFYHQRFNVLVCTTIIETGIDIPTANTIIIDRADRFGLAQLHQLRGRVGRSHHQAYAYLLLPHKKSLTTDAQKRLEAFASLQDLGVGFMLATHDLEIRGAGELLGEEQSGAIQAIGLNLYLELLNKTIDYLHRGITLTSEVELEHDIQIELRIPALFPDYYIDDAHIRLLLYKRLTGIIDQNSLDEFKVELIDRFGFLPEPAENLLALHKLKLLALPLGIVNLKQPKRDQIAIRFNTHPNINVSTLLKYIQTGPERYQFDGATRVKIILKENEDLLVACSEFLESLK